MEEQIAQAPKVKTLTTEELLKKIEPHKRGDAERAIKALRKKIKDAGKDKKVDAAEVLVMVAIGMELVENFRGLSGIEKKKLVKGVIRTMIMTELKVSDEDMIAISYLLNTTLGPTIDIIYNVATKAYKIGSDAVKNCCLPTK